MSQPHTHRTRARRRLGAGLIRAARASRLPRIVVLAAPPWAWPVTEIALLATVATGVTLAAMRAWAPVAQLGAPRWAALLALAVPAGGLARLAKDAPTAVTEYRNRRDHAIETLKGHLT